MVDSQAIKTKFRSAFASQDPDAVARALDLPTIAEQKAKREPRNYQPESFMIDDVDCSAVLAGLLNASEAAESVSPTIDFRADHGSFTN